jgi:hypothetical protein
MAGPEKGDNFSAVRDTIVPGGGLGAMFRQSGFFDNMPAKDMGSANSTLANSFDNLAGPPTIHYPQET